MSIHTDIESGNLASIKAYLAAGGDREARGSMERTPLHVAAEKTQVAAVRLLLDGGADPNAVDYRQFTPLHKAAEIGSADIVEALLRASADANARNAFQSTPLHAIAGGGGLADANSRAKIVEQLLAAGGQLEALDSANRTPLWFAAATGTAPLAPDVMKARLAVVGLLLSKGADPRRGEPGSRPLDAARGLHQSKKYRIVWPEAVDLLEAAPPR